MQTAYLPALAALAENTEIWGFDPAITLPGVMSASTLEALLAEPLDRLVIATPSLLHLPVLEQALASAIPLILVEKPVVATLAQHDRLHALLADPEVAARVLALDHWMARNAVQQLLLSGKLDEGWQPREPGAPGSGWPPSPISARWRGFCWNPAAWTRRGIPMPSTSPPGSRIGGSCAIQTGHPRHRHPSAGDDPGTAGGPGWGRPPAPDRGGRLRPAGAAHPARGSGDRRGRACLRGEAAGCPLTLWLDKYAGPGVEKKGLCLHLRDGRRIELLRCGNLEWLHHHDVDGMRGWQREGPSIATASPRPCWRPAFGRWAGVTARRLQEVALLLELQQGLRGPIDVAGAIGHEGWWLAPSCRTVPGFGPFLSAALSVLPVLAEPRMVRGKDWRCQSFMAPYTLQSDYQVCHFHEYCHFIP